MKSPKFVAPKSLTKADELIKARKEAFAAKSEWTPPLPPKPERFPVYLTIEEVSHIILAVEYADVDKYCDDTVLTDINARLGAVLANYCIAREI